MIETNSFPAVCYTCASDDSYSPSLAERHRLVWSLIGNLRVGEHDALNFEAKKEKTVKLYAEEDKQTEAQVFEKGDEIGMFVILS